jgi:hypothetical protein
MKRYLITSIILFALGIWCLMQIGCAVVKPDLKLAVIQMELARNLHKACIKQRQDVDWNTGWVVTYDNVLLLLEELKTLRKD